GWSFLGRARLEGSKGAAGRVRGEDEHRGELRAGGANQPEAIRQRLGERLLVVADHASGGLDAQEPEKARADVDAAVRTVERLAVQVEGGVALLREIAISQPGF